jgi:hypothetical protein
MLPLKGYLLSRNGTWSSGKTQLGMGTLKAMLVTTVNYDGTCVESFTMLLTKKDCPKKIHNFEKYSNFLSYCL